MCGLTGFVSARRDSAEALVGHVRRMSDAMTHRGPDGHGEWVDPECGVALGFRRLAIVDLSPMGDQPMRSASGRYVATFNGEIYNLDELRGALEAANAAPAYRGHSDTEVMLASFEAWGIAAAVPRFNGMFAIAVWDRQTRRLSLIRDRMGVKPLYYGFGGQTFLFGSELKAIRRHADFSPAINRGAVQLFLRYLSVPDPHCIYEGFAKVMPGTILVFDPETRATDITAYWSVMDAVMRGRAHPFRGTDKDATERLDELLRDAVRLRMVADVPVGVFLSGGVDSSVVAALMQAQSPTPVRSVAVGFSDAAYNEAPYAKAVAAHLGTAHTEVVMTSADVMRIVPRLPTMYDEPFADSSQIPTHLVSAVARQQVTVSLSGDGGDEFFGGYTRYFVGDEVLRRVGAVPGWMRPVIGRALLAIPPHLWDRVLSGLRAWLPGGQQPTRPGARVHKIARAMAAPDPDALYFELVSNWIELVRDASLPATPVRTLAPPLADAAERMMFFDQISYLPNDILTKVDRASMAVSLEAREPLLDYRLVEFAWQLPRAMKIRDGKGKYLLREVLRRYVPDALIERPKMGFGIPLASWLRGPLRAWADELLDPEAMRHADLFDPAPVRRKWEEHLAGTRDAEQELWGVLMLLAWLRDPDSLRSPA